MPAQEIYEIPVLAHHDCPCASSRIMDRLVGGITQPKVSHGDRVQTGEGGRNPLSQRGRKLGVDPEGHAAITG